jgi:hypothetical protein
MVIPIALFPSIELFGVVFYPSPCVDVYGLRTTEYSVLRLYVAYFVVLSKQCYMDGRMVR